MKNTNFESILENINSYLKSKNLDYYDVRLETTKTNRISIENKIIKEINLNEVTGVGIRILEKGKLGFCSTTNPENYKQIIDDCIKSTLKISTKTKFKNWAENNSLVKTKFKDFEELPLEKKVKELMEINNNILKSKVNYKILQSNVIYLEKIKQKYFINPDSFVYQDDPHVIFYSSITGKSGNTTENYMERFGETGGLEKLDFRKLENLAKKNVNNVSELLKAKACPAIKAEIILTPNLVDLLAHEAIGHASEADAVVNDSSVLKIGQVLSENKEINIVDNPLLNEFGHFSYDDEGIKAREKIIVKKGVVNDYLTDIESATILGKKSNGSARAESFNCKPIVRMSNTYFLEGREKLDSVVKDFNGYLLDGFAGGQVDPSVGTFMFGIKKAYQYKQGKIIGTFKQASISGNILDYLKNVSAVTNKVGEFGFGFCGKEGQTAFVSGSGPHLKIDNAVIGGTKHE
ncbi:MAG: TldD/PmbA family protein [archaeon]|jgi:TldD protein